MSEEKSKSIGKKVLTIVITVLLTLIVLFCIFFVWVMISNPLNVRGMILYKMGWVDEPVKIIDIDGINPPTTEPTTKVSPSLSPDLPSDFIPAPVPIPMTPAQREAVEDFGIDPDSIIISPQMEECFVEKLGQSRVDEIIGGVTPGAMDLFKASSCL